MAFPAVIDLSALDGTDGFQLNGIDAFDTAGFSVSGAGDINGDGFDDIIIGAYDAGRPDYLGAGESYVIYGSASGFAANFDLASLNGTNGFRLDGEDANEASGRSVSAAGDVNGDGFADFIIGADGSTGSEGRSYVVFGKAGSFGAAFDLATLDGANGFRLDGVSGGDFSGASVSSAGDVNGDGFDDILIASNRADPGGRVSAGESYVVFGKASGFAAAIDLATLNGTTGFRIQGVDAGDYSSVSVSSAGDFNGDGFDDIVIGAYYGEPDGDTYAGESYIIFGKAGGFSATLDLASLDGSNGFRLDGIDPGDYSGRSVSGAGDVNGDGFDDVIIGAYGAASDTGESYVVFGAASGFSAGFDLGSLDGSNGFRLDGVDGGDQSGRSVSAAGDVNGDGFDDVIIGAEKAGSDTGESYVVFGQNGGFAASIDLDTLDGTNGFRIDGDNTGDLAATVSSAGDINDDGFDDLIIGARGGQGSFTGESYVVFGIAPDTAVNRVGSAGGQQISGGAFNDTLSGLGGNDTLIGNAGDDTLDGGVGGDTVIYKGSSTDYTVSGVPGNATVSDNNAGDGDDGTDTVLNVETIFFRGDGVTFSFNEDPVAGNDTASVDEDGSVVINVLANDSDPDTGDILAVSSVTTPANGTATIGADNRITYTPDANFNGTDTFNYTIDDGNGATDTATVTVTVNSVNDAPTIDGLSDNDAAEFSGNGTNIGTILATDIDSMLVFSLSNNAGGRFAINPNTGLITVADGLALDFEQNTSHVITVQVSDGSVTLTRDFTIDVTDINSPETPGADAVGRRLVGDDGGDTLRGGGGDDTLAGGAGGDSLNGGAGLDTLDYSASADAVSVNLDSRAVSGGDAQGDTVSGFENALGGGGSDTLTGDDGNNFLDGGNQTDLISGGLGDDTLFGSAGDDTIDGGVGNDRIQGNVRSDSILGGGGSDTLQGNNGDDIIDGGSGGDRILGGPADDLIAGGSGNDTILGNNNEDTIDGGAGGDLVFGGALNDSILGDSGGDDLKGNAGDDTIRGGTGGDSISGQANDDLLYGDANNDTVSGNGGNDSVFGGDGADLLRGNAGDDIVYGEAGADQLLGGNGDDIIVGGAGEDRLAGNNGSDVFIFTEGDSGSTLASADLITDFSQAENDVIRLVGIDAIAGGGDDSFSFIGTAAFSGTAGELRYEQTGGDTHIFADTNGDGTADFALRLLGDVDLVAGDFVL